MKIWVLEGFGEYPEDGGWVEDVFRSEAGALKKLRECEKKNPELFYLINGHKVKK